MYYYIKNKWVLRLFLLRDITIKQFWFTIQNPPKIIVDTEEFERFYIQN